GPGTDDLAPGEPTRAVRDLLLGAGGGRREVEGRPEDRPREQDRHAERQPRGRDRRSDGEQGQRQRPEPVGEPEVVSGSPAPHDQRPAGETRPAVAEARSISKSFGTTRALDDVSLSVTRG